MGQKNYKKVPGTIVQCKSGRYLAFYEHRMDIIANGESEVEAKKNLKKMYSVVLKHEKQEEGTKSIIPSFKTKHFTEKITC